MSDAILVLNAGSSSIKFSVFPSHDQPNRQDIMCEGECEGIGHRVHFTAKDRAGASLVDEYLAEGTSHEEALAALLRWLEDRFTDHQLVAAGHRVVHGGSLYAAPVLVDASVSAELRRLIPLAPLVFLLFYNRVVGYEKNRVFYAMMVVIPVLAAVMTILKIA